MTKKIVFLCGNKAKIIPPPVAKQGERFGVAKTHVSFHHFPRREQKTAINCCDRIRHRFVSGLSAGALPETFVIYILVPGSSLGPFLCFSRHSNCRFHFSGHFKFMRNSVLMFIQGSKLKWMLGACCVCIDRVGKNNKCWTGSEGLLKGGPLYSGYLRTSILLRVFD